MTEVVAAFIGAIAAIAVYYLSARDLKRQDRDAKKREIRLQFLIEAYRQIEYSSNRPPSEMPEAFKKIECAISDIQLFGTSKQVALASDVVGKAAAGGGLSFDELLDELRRDLRLELELESLPEGRRIGEEDFEVYESELRTRRSSEREPADSLRDKSNVIGGWLPSLTLALALNAHAHT